jgi:hypothetical protein
MFGEKTEDPSDDPQYIIKNDILNILMSSSQLARKVKELSMHLDSVERVADALSDVDTRNRLKQSAEQSRETLIKATFILRRQVNQLPPLHRQLADAIARTNEAENLDPLGKNWEMLGQGIVTTGSQH